MARIRVEVSQDRMSATLTVAPGDPTSEADLAEAIDRAGVRFGIDEALVRRVGAALGQASFAMASEVVATGVPPAKGADGSFETAFLVGILPGRRRDDDTLDFLDRELVKSVRQDEPVGRFVSPAPGTPGRRVDGSELPASAGRPSPVRLGPNVVLGPDDVVRAVTGGAIVYVAGRSVDVQQHFEHKGDVDLRTGHLEMEGSITVTGSVAPDFVVRATGDVEVKGTCDGACVFAGGNVQIAGLVRGGASGGVTASGDVTAGAAESVAIEAGGGITLQNAVHADLRGARVAISKHVRGGHVRAETALVVGDAGSVAGAVTVLEAGVPRESPDDVRAAVGRAKAFRSLGRDSRGKGARVGAALGRQSIEEKIAQAQAREALLAAAVVEVRGTLHPGATIRIGDLRFEVDWAVHAVRVSYDLNTHTLRVEHSHHE